MRNLFFGFLVITLFSGELFSQPKMPELNKQVVDYVSTVIGQQVDRGECWDLANQALTKIGAKWDLEYIYGEKLDPEKETIYPGDIIQFEGVKLKYKKGNYTYEEEMEHHTAIVYKVLSKGVYELAHQNTGFSGRKVGLSELKLDDVVKGKLKFYRPVRS